ncbi:MAG TPA: protein kinase [Polyangiaceae bacterium]|jgi:serine/threonine-protein kinase|nr:protein kinase [Polyangiaceae bacterium]
MVQRIPEQRSTTVGLGNPPVALEDDGAEVQDDELISGDEASRPEASPRFSSPRLSRRLPRLSLGPAAGEGEILVGRYRVERILSRTSHEVVLEASHLELGQRVLLRHLSSLASTSPEAVARFQRGARKAREMRSEHAERVVDYGRLDNGSPYRAVELPRGPSLAEILRVRGALPISEAVDIVLTACEPVAEAHASGVVHRCLGTANIFVERRSDGAPLVRVLDFGVSDPLEPDWVNGDDLAAPGAGASVEALRYASPEQIRNPSAVDARADVWALGAVLYELIAGAPLFQAEGPLTLLSMIAADVPTPLGMLRTDVPADLEQLVLSCLEKDPNARPRSVVEVVLALSPYASPDAQAAAARVARIVMRTTRPPALPSQGPLAGSHSAAPHRALVRSYPPPRHVEVPLVSRPEARSFGLLLAGAAIGLGAALLAPRLAPSSTSAPVAPVARTPAVVTAPPAAAPPAAALAARAEPGPALAAGAEPGPTLAAVARAQPAVAARPVAAPQPAVARAVAPQPTVALRPVVPAVTARAGAATHALADGSKPSSETKTASADDLFGGTD